MLSSKASVTSVKQDLLPWLTQQQLRMTLRPSEPDDAASSHAEVGRECMLMSFTNEPVAALDSRALAVRARATAQVTIAMVHYSPVT